MKKLLKYRTFSVSLLLVVLSFSIGCGKTDNSLSATAENFIYEPKTKMSYDFTDETQLNKLVTVLAGEKHEIEIVQAGIADFEDRQGSFKAISAQYRVGEELTNLVVPLSNYEGANEIVNAAYVADGCEMKCTSAWGCQACSQTIIERCKTQTCRCASGGGGCSSKITFPPHQQ